MRILYFSSAIKENDFQIFNSHWKFPLNPSNQNFHHNLIECLSMNNKVDVFSIRPFSKTNCDLSKLEFEEKEQGNITWYYLERKTKFDNLYKQIKIKDEQDTIIIVDSLNIRAVDCAKKIAKKYKYKIIGICTDSPNNISNMKWYNKKLILSINKKLDGYISLTESLNELFNKKNKPSIIIHGLCKQKEKYKENDKGKYILFSGSLLERYGIYKLIDAFKNIENKNINLLIYGHHKELKFDEYIKSDRRISFEGCIDQQALSNLQHNALMCVNPRPVDEQIDKYSYPSKILEYINHGKIVISTKNPLIINEFKDSIIYYDENIENSLESAINKALNLDEIELKKIINENRKILKAKYSFDHINNELNSFIEKLLRK